MIALTVLSTMLILGTMILIQIGAIFSKGVNTANLQNANRNISSEIVSTLQFSGTPPARCNSSLQNTCFMGQITGSQNGGYKIYAYCVDTVRYSYVMNREQGTDTDATVENPADQKYTPHVMWRDTLRSAYVPCVPLDISVDRVKADENTPEGDGADSKGHEVVPNRTRLTRFLIPNPTGEDGNIYDVSIAMAYGDSDLVNVTNDQGDVTCNGGKGTEYCAVSQLSSTVKRRVVQ